MSKIDFPAARDVRRSIAGRSSVAQRWRRLLVATLAAIGFVAAGNGASAQTPAIGTAVEVTPAAFGELGGTEVTLLTGAELYEGQTITTDANGEVQIVFVDNTRMVLGPNSALVIERYLLRSPDTVEDLTVNILGGAFRFISGNSPSESYTVSTPTGDIVVRGTGFDGYTDWLTGITEILLYLGSVYLCPTDQPCIYIDVDCSIGVIDVQEAAVIRDEGVRVGLANEHFPFAGEDFFLLEDFRLGDTAECLEDMTPVEEVEEEEVPPPPPPTSDVSCESDSCIPPCTYTGSEGSCIPPSCISGSSGCEGSPPSGCYPSDASCIPECVGIECIVCESALCYCPEIYEEECGEIEIGYAPAGKPPVYALRRLVG